VNGKEQRQLAEKISYIQPIRFSEIAWYVHHLLSWLSFDVSNAVGVSTMSARFKHAHWFLYYINWRRLPVLVESYPSSVSHERRDLGLYVFVGRSFAWRLRAVKVLVSTSWRFYVFVVSFTRPIRIYNEFRTTEFRESIGRTWVASFASLYWCNNLMCFLTILSASSASLHQRVYVTVRVIEIMKWWNAP